MLDNLRLPPFGKILLAYHEQKVRLHYPIYIHIGKNAKNYAYYDIQHGSIASFVPDGDDFLRFKWPIQGQHVVVVDHGDIQQFTLDKIIYSLRNYKPRILYLWSEEHKPLYFKEDSQ